MRELDESFATLLGRQPSDAERQQLYRVRDALGLHPNDALWLVLMALQYYQRQYEQVPQAIEETTHAVLAEVKGTAEATVEAASEAGKAALAQAVAASAQQVARQVAGKQKAQWIAGCVAVVALCLGGVFWYAHNKAYTAGFNNGYGVGYHKSQDEKAAAAWANTPEGYLAYRLAKLGEVQRLARCQGKGWKREDGMCYPHGVVNEGVYGWRLP